MQQTIAIGTKRYLYTLRKNLRMRRLRLSVSATGVLSVSAPVWVTSGFIERFLREQAEWIEERLGFFQKRGASLLGQGGRHEYAQYKERARTLATMQLAHFNQSYGYTYGQISIRNQKTRWGSCSKQGNLSFNYRIALLPPALADYVILHELCHLGAFDHSDRFWVLMARMMPDYLKRRQALRRAGMRSVS